MLSPVTSAQYDDSWSAQLHLSYHIQQVPYLECRNGVAMSWIEQLAVDLISGVVESTSAEPWTICIVDCIKPKCPTLPAHRFTV